MNAYLQFFLFFLLTYSQSFAQVTAYRATIIHMIENPSLTDHDQKSFEYFKDGLLIIHKGRVHAIGEYAKLKSKLPSTVKPVEYPNQWIAPPNRRRI